MAKERHIIINGDEFHFEQGETILQVARRNGIDIPTLCYLKGLVPAGASRMCVIEVQGACNVVGSCPTPAAHNMVVKPQISMPSL